ncbi:hypothetical protein GCM10027051_10620 [Niabella terrae]
MKQLLLFLGWWLLIHAPVAAQTKEPAEKSAREYILEREEQRSQPPNTVKPGAKTINSAQDSTSGQKVVKEKKQKKCSLFCRKKKVKTSTTD